MKKYRIEIIAGAIVIIGVLLLIDLTPILNAIDRFAVTIARSLTPAMLIGLELSWRRWPSSHGASACDF